MSLENRPTKKSVDALLSAVGTAAQKFGDKYAALKIWNDFRWSLKTTKPRTYQEIELLIDVAVGTCHEVLKSPEVRDGVLLRFAQMKARLSEFTIEELTQDGEDEQTA